MKKTFITLFALGILLVSSARAQDCSKGDETANRTYSLYKEYFKQGAYDRALPYWRESYTKSPGLRKAIFVDGADIYTDLITKTEDKQRREAYIDTLMAIYDKRIQCWGDKGYVLSIKAIDLARFRPDQYPKAKEILEEAINLDQINSKFYALTTYFNILINLKDEPNGVNADFIKKEYAKLIAICDANIAAGDENAASFAQAKEEMTFNLKKYVLPQRFADGAEWYSETFTTERKIDSLTKWMKEDSSVTNLEELATAANRDENLRDTDIRYEIEKKLLEINPTSNRANNIGAWYYEAKKYEEAVPYFLQAIELATDAKAKAGLYLSLGDTYRLMNKFPEARDAARNAIGQDSASGKPYYLIGVLYMSSGKLCGPGTGFDSQRVLWPAFDYLNKAKELDPSYAEVVEPLMKEYKKYLPTRAEIVAKGLKVGGTYLVPCWIQEEATVVSKD